MGGMCCGLGEEWYVGRHEGFDTGSNLRLDFAEGERFRLESGFDVVTHTTDVDLMGFPCVPVMRGAHCAGIDLTLPNLVEKVLWCVKAEAIRCLSECCFESIKEDNGVSNGAIKLLSCCDKRNSGVVAVWLWHGGLRMRSRARRYCEA